ncbi:MAG: hypothetical protein IT198_15280 [Acidimicrobiia bacterium]|nr:hypothetical protein [Acidimicrobiia bacterium]
MGLFKKMKEGAQQAAQQAQQAIQSAAPGGTGTGVAADGYVHVKGAGPVDPAILGGPSTKPVAADDPIWEPINGVSLQDYADVARDAQAQGINDEAGMRELAAARGFDPDVFKAGMDGWVQRMGQSQAVGQQFRRFLGY